MAQAVEETPPHGTPSERQISAASTGRRLVETYDYTDERNRVLFQVVRYEPKDFRQRHPDRTQQGGWAWNLNECRLVLFRLPEVEWAVGNGLRVFVVEGEKDVLALEAAGEVGTCNPMGAGNWRPDYAEALRGAEVIVVADKNPPGYRHARQVQESLAGVAASVRVVQAAEGCVDAAEHLAAGYGSDDLMPATPPDTRAQAPEVNRSRASGQELLRRAVERSADEGRNNAGVWLVCQLRDNRYPL